MAAGERAIMPLINSCLKLKGNELEKKLNKKSF
jgi:hypothetical protein